MIDQYPPANGVLTSLIWRKTAAGGETSLSGYDNANQALSYTPGQEQVYLNGILLVRGDDYTATNGISITGLAALSASDFVQVNCYNNFSVASVPTTSLTGTVTNAQLANSAITINGSSVSLGGSVTLAGDIESVTASSPLTGGGTSGAVTIGIQSASTSQSGAVQLTDSTSSTSTTTAATPASVKSSYDLANAAIPKNLTTTTGDIIYASGANTPARLGIGSTGQVLTVSGGVPAWGAASSGGGPTFSAYLSSTQTINYGTFTKVQADTEEWDSDSCYNTTDYRFTPNKSGKYLVTTSGVISLGSPDDTTILRVYKNGSAHKYCGYTLKPYGGNSAYWAGACVVTMNGTTDYIEMYQYFYNGNRTLSADLASWNWNATWIAN